MRKKNTFIIGHYGGDNFGDEFMLEALLEYLNQVENVGKIFIVNKKSDCQNSRATYVSPGFLSVLKVLLQTKMLILGGGTHFHDDYHEKRLRKHYLYLTKILLISFLYRLTFKKVYYLGVGYAPLKSTKINNFAKLSLLLAHRITVRDKVSLQNLQRLKPRSQTLGLSLTFDLASLHKEVGRENTKADGILGISLTSFGFSSNANNDMMWGNHIIPQIGSAYKRTQISVRIFVFRGGSRESDIPLSKKLQEHLLEIDPSRVELIEYTDNTEKFITPLSECNYFIATRYHSAVISYLLGCRLLIIPYHQKLIDIVQMIDLDMHAVVDLQKPETFTHKLTEMLANDEKYLPKISPLKNKCLTLREMNAIFSQENVK